MRPSIATKGEPARLAGEVLDAAARVFARQGYEGTSIDDIADELGATKGRVYHYYRSKADILLDVLNKGQQDLVDIIRPLAEDTTLPADQRLLNMARAHAEVMMYQHPYQYVSLRSLNPNLFDGKTAQREGWRTIRKMREEYEELFRAVVEEGSEDGTFSTTNPRLTVRGILGSLNWITVWFHPDHQPQAKHVSKEEIAQTLAKFVVAGARG